MFTGIIKQVGKVASLVNQDGKILITFSSPKIASQLSPGSSVSINGACLTVLKNDKDSFEVEIVSETLRKTNLGGLKVGDVVNLEQPLKIGGRLDGHFVLGHIDATGTIKAIGKRDNDTILEVDFPQALAKFIAPKGSITIDGISLTVADMRQNTLSIALISHTLANTNLSSRKAGDKVNIEVDMLARYIDKLQEQHGS